MIPAYFVAMHASGPPVDVHIAVVKAIGTGNDEGNEEKEGKRRMERLRANYHTHTVFCDGSNKAEEVVEQAIALGFTHLGFSGHMDPDIHMDFPRYKEEIQRLQKQYQGQLDIILGVELDNIYDPHCADDAEYKIGSTQFLYVETETPMSVDNTPEIMEALAKECYGGDYYALAKAYYQLEAKVYDRLHCDFVGHFDLVTRFNDQMHFLDEEDPRYLNPALEAMEYLVKEGVPFEINCGAVNRGRKKELYPNRRLLKALHDFGGEILLNSDAHQKELLDGAFETAVHTAVECGFTHTNLLIHDEQGRLIWHPLALDRLY